MIIVFSSLVVSAKLASKLIARDMVNFGVIKRVAPALLESSKQWLVDSISDVATSVRNHQETDFSSSDEMMGKQQQTASTEYLVYNWLEWLFAWFQMIILWHEPFMSFCAISGLVTSFLLLTYFAPRFYATIMIVIFIYNLNRYWFRYVWPDIRVPPGAEREAEMRSDVDRFTYLHPQLMTLAELGVHIDNFVASSHYHLLKLLHLRHEKPVTFCTLICSFLSCTAYIGNRISGESLVLGSFVILFTAPGIYYHLLSDTSRLWLQRKLHLILCKAYHNTSAQSGVENHANNDIEEENFAINSQKPLEIQSAVETPSEVESFASTVASSTKAQALSILEQLKLRSFGFSSATNEQTGTTTQVGDLTRGHSGVATGAPSPRIDVPSNQDQDKQSPLNHQRQRKPLGDTDTDHEYDDDDHDENSDNREDDGKEEGGSSCNSRSERGPGSSVCLIDSDDEQQDGFVLL